MTPTPAAGRRFAGLGLKLFALPFAAIGVGALVWGASDVREWRRMSSWTAVSAQVLAVDFVEHDGDDSTTYKTTATYRYEYAGQEYTSTRVAIGSGSDNIGDFQRRLYWQLQAAHEHGTPLTAYVDPGNPSAVVINRELRWGMLMFKGVFVLLFGGVGFGLLFGSRAGARKLAAEATLQTRYPNEPWRWRPEWATGRIASSTRATAYVATGFAFVWNLVSLPAAIFVPGEIAGGNALAAIALLFPLVGLGLAAWAVRAWWQLRRFKVATLALDRMPVALGGRLKGSIRVDAEVPGVSDFRFELACIEERVSGSGKNRRRDERLLWQKEWRVPRHQCQLGDMLSVIPIDLAMPTEPPAASPNDDNPKIIWRLDVATECPGPDFWSRFELPVFDVGERHAPNAATAASAATIGAPSADASLPAPDSHTLAALGIAHERLPQGGEAWTFRLGANKNVAFGIMGAAVAGLFVTGAAFASGVPIILAIAVTALEGVFAYLALSLWFTEYRVTLARGLLTLARRGFMARAPIEIPLKWIRGVRAERGMQAGNKLFYNLTVETSDGTHTAASTLADYDVARWLAQHWMAAKAQA